MGYAYIYIYIYGDLVIIYPKPYSIYLRGTKGTPRPPAFGDVEASGGQACGCQGLLMIFWGLRLKV